VIVLVLEASLRRFFSVLMVAFIWVIVHLGPRVGPR
jgi:hypothetical protein